MGNPQDPQAGAVCSGRTAPLVRDSAHKECSQWEGLMLEKFMENYLPEHVGDCMLEQRKDVRSPSLEEEVVQNM